jgi:serine/threonine-protein kinase
VAGLVKTGNDQWQSVMAEKDYELQDLKAIIARQDKELQLMRQKATATPAGASAYAQRGTVSKASFNVLLIVLFIVGGLAVYGLFFNRSVVGAANADDNSLTISDSMTVRNEESNLALSENQKAAKEKKRVEKASPAKDSATKQKNVAAGTERSETKSTPKDTATAENREADNKEEETTDTEENNTGTTNNVRYKIRNKAFFHNEPDESTRREAFIVHWNNAVLKPLDEKNGYIYVVFTNHLGQVSKGWLSKKDLIQVK